MSDREPEPTGAGEPTVPGEVSYQEQLRRPERARWWHLSKEKRIQKVAQVIVPDNQDGSPGVLNEVGQRRVHEIRDRLHRERGFLSERNWPGQETTIVASPDGNSFVIVERYTGGAHLGRVEVNHKGEIIMPALPLGYNSRVDGPVSVKLSSIKFEDTDVGGEKFTIAKVTSGSSDGKGGFETRRLRIGQSAQPSRGLSSLARIFTEAECIKDVIQNAVKVTWSRVDSSGAVVEVLDVGVPDPGGAEAFELDIHGAVARIGRDRGLARNRYGIPVIGAIRTGGRFVERPRSPGSPGNPEGPFKIRRPGGESWEDLGDEYEIRPVPQLPRPISFDDPKEAIAFLNLTISQQERLLKGLGALPADFDYTRYYARVAPFDKRPIPEIYINIRSQPEDDDLKTPKDPDRVDVVRIDNFLGYRGIVQSMITESTAQRARTTDILLSREGPVDLRETPELIIRLLRNTRGFLPNDDPHVVMDRANRLAARLKRDFERSLSDARRGGNGKTRIEIADEITKNLASIPGFGAISNVDEEIRARLALAISGRNPGDLLVFAKKNLNKGDRESDSDFRRRVILALRSSREGDNDGFSEQQAEDWFSLLHPESGGRMKDLVTEAINTIGLHRTTREEAVEIIARVEGEVPMFGLMSGLLAAFASKFPQPR